MLDAGCSTPGARWWTLWAGIALLLVCAAGTVRAQADDAAMRQEMVERAHQYLLGVHKEQSLGDSRRITVTSAYVLASLSSGCLPSDPRYGASLTSAVDWVLANGTSTFFGGREEPYADHALACLMMTELLGTYADAGADASLYRRCMLAVDHSLKVQDKGVGADYFGGWRRNDETRVNDRMLTAWYLLLLRSAELRALEVPEAAVGRAVEFVAASQRLETGGKPDERGGFSVDAHGLPVRSTTGAGLAALALFDPENEEAVKAARDWLERHPPRWHGPNFYESNFFAVRGLYRSRRLDGGRAYERYFSRLVRLLKERQDADGSFPFPPGHGGPILAMGRAYSTAMAILILNVDRGIIPMDK